MAVIDWHGCAVSARCGVFNGRGSRDDKGIASYRWDFGTGASSTQPEVRYFLPAADTYSVRLTVTDTAGQTGSTSISVTVP